MSKLNNPKRTDVVNGHPAMLLYSVTMSTESTMDGFKKPGKSQISVGNASNEHQGKNTKSRSGIKDGATEDLRNSRSHVFPFHGALKNTYQKDQKGT